MISIGDSGRFELKVDGENEHKDEGADAEDQKMDGSPIWTQPQHNGNRRLLSEKELQKNTKVNGPLNLKMGGPRKLEFNRA